MRQLKAMVRKEWQTHRKSLMGPVWTMLCIYGIGLISLIYGSIRFGLPNIVSSTYTDAQLDQVIWAFHYGSAIFIAWLSILAALGLVELCLNTDHIKKCEIFHLAQPVSLTKIFGSKALFLGGGILIQYLVLVIVNSLILSIITSIVGYPSLSIGLSAILNSIPYIVNVMLLIVPLIWFFSSIFRKMAGIKLMVFLVFIEVIRGIFRISWGISLYSPFGFIRRIVLSPFEVASNYVIDVMEKSTVTFSFVGWNWNYTWEHLAWLLMNIILVVASYYIYKRRNVC
jgi:hypothetical protein